MLLRLEPARRREREDCEARRCGPDYVELQSEWHRPRVQPLDVSTASRSRRAGFGRLPRDFTMRHARAFDAAAPGAAAKGNSTNTVFATSSISEPDVDEIILRCAMFVLERGDDVMQLFFSPLPMVCVCKCF